MILPFLSDEERSPLSEMGFPSLTAVWRPMDITDKARWADAVRRAGVEVESAEAKVLAVRQQLIGIDGLEAVGSDNIPAKFDPKNDKHFAALPSAIVFPLYDVILNRSCLSESTAGN